jgi:putative oxidoreductase
MNLFSKITKPILLPHWTQDLVATIPRTVCGYLFAFDFGADKFGMP